MKCSTLLILLLLASCAGRTDAVRLDGHARPSPTAHQDWRAELDLITGTWVFEGIQGGVASTFRESCQWIPGGSFIVCKVEGGSGLSMIGWEEHNQRFVHYGISPVGKVDVLVGELVSPTWRFGNAHERVSMVRETPDRWSFKAEVLDDDGSWTLVVDGQYVRAEESPVAPGSAPAASNR